MTSILKLTYLFVILLVVGYCQAQEIVKTTKKTKYSSQKTIKEDYFVQRKNPDIKHGLYEYYFNGKRLIEGYYLNGKRTGEWIFSDNVGNKLISCSYNDDKKNGKWIYFIDNKRVSELFYDEGLPTGTWISYYPNDSVNAIEHYENHLKSGEKIVYYEDRKVKEISHYDDDTLHGSSKRYYEDGQLFIEISFRNGRPDGIYRKYYNNSQLFIEAEYDNGKLISVNKIYNRKGKPLDIGTFANGNGTLNFYEFQSEDSIKLYCKAKATYLDGYKSGSYYIYNEKGDYLVKGLFIKGIRCGLWENIERKRVVSNTNYDEACKKEEFDLVDYLVSPINHTSSGSSIERKPKFPGGENVLLKLLATNTNYPTTARENNIQGKVYLGFILEKTGEVADIKILKGVHSLLDNEAKRVVSEMPPWAPGLADGLPVTVSYQVPISFKLN